jgi:DNA-binding NarL/FixJ family response regulator
VTIRILLVDDQALVRAGFAMILSAADDLEVVGEAADGQDAILAARRTRPDVVLMDIRMPRMDGIEATRALVALPATPRVLILTTYSLDEYVYAALRAGASGFLLKDAPPEELRRAVRVVAAGDALLSPSVTRRLLSDFARGAEPAPADATDLEVLTGREREVLTLVAEGLSNGEIADRLVVGEATVKTHVGHIFAKLGLRDRVQAVVVAYRTGLVRPPRA